MLLRILVGLSLISIGISSMLIGENVENRIVSTYYSNWLFANIFYRILIASLLYVGFLILTGYKNSFLKILLILFNTFIVLDSVLAFQISDSFDALFIHPYFKIESILPIGLLIFSSIFYLFEKKPSKTVKKWVFYALIVPSIGLSFIKVVYIEDWTLKASNQQKISPSAAKILLEKNKVKNNQENYLLVFFSTECGHCRATAKKLAISKKNNLLPETIIVFPKEQNQADEFMKSNKLDGIKYFSINLDELISMSGLHSPSVFLMSPSGSTQWVGAEFNNIVLWKLSKYVN